jgi:hypothetical protein
MGYTAIGRLLPVQGTPVLSTVASTTGSLVLNRPHLLRLPGYKRSSVAILGVHYTPKGEYSRAKRVLQGYDGNTTHAVQSANSFDFFLGFIVISAQLRQATVFGEG